MADKLPLITYDNPWVTAEGTKVFADGRQVHRVVHVNEQDGWVAIWVMLPGGQPDGGYTHEGEWRGTRQAFIYPDEVRIEFGLEGQDEEWTQELMRQAALEWQAANNPTPEWANTTRHWGPDKSLRGT